MDELYEMTGKSNDKDMMEIKKEMLKKIKDSLCYIMLFVDDRNVHLIMDGNDEAFAELIGEAMIKSPKFRSMIVGAVKIYQESMN
jgi:hypothetical protein